MSSLDIAADLTSLREIGPWLSQILAEAGSPPSQDLHHTMELALQEVCLNVVQHAYEAPEKGRIRLSCTTDRFHVAVTVADAGVAFDPADRPEVDLDNPTIGGYGLFMIDSLSARVRYERIGSENRWVLIFPLSAQAVT